MPSHLIEQLELRTLFDMTFQEWFTSTRYLNFSGPPIEIHGSPATKDKIIVRRSHNASIEIVWTDGRIFGYGRGPLHVDLGGGADSIYVDPTFGDVPITIYGGDGSDTIYGGRGGDRIFAGAGDDFVYAGDGRDSVYGEAGNDLLRGNGGSDLLSGGDGFDSLRGDAGNDNLDGGASKDRLNGSAGNDQLYGGGGNDICAGEAGDDFLIGGAGIDLLYGGLGIDNFSISENAERMDLDNEDFGLPASASGTSATINAVSGTGTTAGVLHYRMRGAYSVNPFQ